MSQPNVPHIELPFTSHPAAYEPSAFSAWCSDLFAEGMQTFYDPGTERYVLFHMDDVEAAITDRDSSGTLDPQTSKLTIASHGVTIPYVMALMRGAKAVTANADGEVHDKVKRALQAEPFGLSPRTQTMITRYGELVSDELEPLMQPLRDKQPGTTLDLMTDIAQPLASSVIARIQGAPRHLDPNIKGFAEGQTNLLGQHLTGMRLVSALRSLVGLLKFNDSLARQADHHLTFEEPHDLMTQLVDKVGVAHARSAGMNLTAAGYSTTSGIIANAARLSLAESGRELWNALCSAQNSDLQQAALSEIERTCTSLVMWKGRLNKDTLLSDHETTLPKGTNVLYALGVANRDPKIFAEPHRALLNRSEVDRDTFGRKARPHITYGRGPHACIGRTLARLEIQTVFSALGQLETEQGVRFELDEPFPSFQYQPDSLFRSLISLPVFLQKTH